MKIKIRTNLWSGIIIGSISIVLLILLPTEVRIPAYNSGAPSPRIIPTLALVGMLICSGILLIESLVLKKEKYFEFDLKKEAPCLILIGLMCLFSFLIIKIGFIAAIVIVFPIVLFYFGERKPFIYIFTLVAGIGVYYLFRIVLNISLPVFTGFGG